MTDYHIRAMLRRATKDGLLAGWNGPHTDERSYTIAPRHGGAGEWPLARVLDYVDGLAAAGLEPLFRASEPVV